MLNIKKWMNKVTQTILIGEIKQYAGSDEPNGWLKCDGRAISRTTYSALFNVIGTTYGAGDGSTTFNLPDMRDRFPVGAGSSYALNDKGGEETVTLNTNQIPSHTHPNPSNGQFIINKSQSSGYAFAFSAGSYYRMAASETGARGGGQAHENRPPYIGINFLIYGGGIS